MSSKKWSEFEKLAAKIYAELSPQAQVTWDDSIYGHDTNIDRQIDVSIRATLEGQAILIIVQAKDWGTQADINAVGEFASVVRDVRATKGVLVCRSGFSETAKHYARNLGIELINIHDAQSKDWNLEIKVPIVWIEDQPEGNTDVKFTLHLDKEYDIPFSEQRTLILSPDQGKTLLNLWELLKYWWNEGILARATNTIHTKELPKPMYMLGVRKNGQQTWLTLDSAVFKYLVKRKVWLGYFKPEECRGVLNYLTDIFTISYLPMGQIPEKPDGKWLLIENPNRLAIRAKVTPVITKNWIAVFETDTVFFDGEEVSFESANGQT
jgi:hypothetical protein